MARIQTTVLLLIEDEQRLRDLAAISERDRRSLASFALHYLDRRLDEDITLADTLSDLVRIPTRASKHMSFAPPQGMRDLMDRLRQRIFDHNRETFEWPVLLRATFTLWLREHPDDNALLNQLGVPMYLSTA